MDYSILAGTTPSYGNEPTTDIGLEIRWVSAEEEANRRKANLTGKAVKAEHAEGGKTEGISFAFKKWMLINDENR